MALPNKRSNWSVRLRVENPETGGWTDAGLWAVLEGTGVTSEESIYYDWDGPHQLGGTRSREDATVRRLYGRHAGEVYSRLDSWVGRARVQLSRQATDDRGVAMGELIRYTGVLAGAKPPDVEKGSSEAGEIELTLRLDPELA